MAPNYIIHVEGSIHGDLNIAGRDLTIWSAARESSISVQHIKPPIFVSYASADRKIADPLVKRLEKAGYTVWYDEKSLLGGDEWKKEINEGIRRCVAFIPVLTPRSIDEDVHQWAVYEQKQALKLFAPIVPAYAEPCDVPGYFADLQYVDITDLNDESFGRLVAAIEKKLHRRGTQLIDQTPPESRAFIGRQSELEQVVAMLGNETVSISAVQGLGGIGKSMLVEEITRRLRHRYPGGVLFTTLGRNITDAQTVLQEWAGYVDRNFVTQSIEPTQLRGLLSRYGKLLVILDDIWPEDLNASKTLLNALPPDADRIVTTRFDNVATAIGGKTYILDRLSEADGIEMLRDRLENRGPEPIRKQLIRLYNAVGGHPLSLELAAGRIRDTTTIEWHIERLQEKIQSGDISDIALTIADGDKDISLAASLDLSLEALLDNEPDLADPLLMLGVFAENASFDHEAVAAVWKVDKDVAYERLNRLVGWGLISVEAKRFSQHMLVRAFARGLLGENTLWNETFQSYFLHYYDEYRSRVKNRESNDRHRDIILDWPNILNAIWSGLERDNFETHQQVADLLTGLSESFMLFRLSPDFHRELLLTALDVMSSYQTLDKADLLLDLGQLQLTVGDMAGAYNHYYDALETYREFNNKFGVANSLNRLVTIDLNMGNFARAEQVIPTVLNMYDDLDDDLGQANMRMSYGHLLDIDGNAHEAALEQFQMARELFKQENNILGIAQSYLSEANTNRKMDNSADALKQAEKAVSYASQLGYGLPLAQALTSYGIALVTSGDYDKASDIFDEAIDIATAWNNNTALIDIAIHRVDVLLHQNRFHDVVRDLSSLEEYLRPNHLPQQLSSCERLIGKMRSEIGKEKFDPIWSALSKSKLSDKSIDWYEFFEYVDYVSDLIIDHDKFEEEMKQNISEVTRKVRTIARHAPSIDDSLNLYVPIVKYIFGENIAYSLEVGNFGELSDTKMMYIDTQGGQMMGISLEFISIRNEDTVDFDKFLDALDPARVITGVPELIKGIEQINTVGLANLTLIRKTIPTLHILGWLRIEVYLRELLRENNIYVY